MSQTSCYRVTFSVVNAAGNVTSGPYTSNIGISGGKRDDIHSPTVTAALLAAVTSNLAGILLAMGAGSGAPGGTVRVENYAHAASPDLWM
jgi:hypothetical protein